MAQAHRIISDIPGWGADLDPAQRPAVPKEKPSDVMTVRGQVGVRQKPTVKIHKSVEHPDLTPVFGTTCPPRGLSGRLRDFAYRYSEDRLLHWMTLIAADRVDVVEGLLEDLARGQLPNPIKERGLKSELTYADRERMRRNLMIVGVGIGAIGLALLTYAKVRKEDA